MGNGGSKIWIISKFSSNNSSYTIKIDRRLFYEKYIYNEKNKKEKINKGGFLTKNIIGLMKYFLVFAIFIFISALLSLLIPNYSKEISNIFSMLFIIYSLIKYTRFIGVYSNRREIIILEKSIKKSNNSPLYEWIANDYGHNILMYKWLGGKQKKHVIDNLKNIKENILMDVGDNVYNYHLIKKYLDHQRKHNLLNIFWDKIIYTFMTVLLSVGLYINVDIFNWINNNLLSINTNNNMFGQFEMILRIFAVALMVIISFIFVYNEFTKEKRRLDLLTDIIDLIIFEKTKKMCKC